MKNLSFYKLLISTIVICSFSSCSSSDNTDDQDLDPYPEGSSFITCDIQGTPVHHEINISDADETNEDNTIILGYVYNEETSEGIKEVVSLRYSIFDPNGISTDIYMEVPAAIGTFSLGEFQTGSTGIISYEPLYNMKISLDEQYAFYDGDNDGDNDIISLLLSKTVGVTITEIETTTDNSFGVPILKHIKGSFQGVAFFKAFTSPTTDPEELTNTVTGNFEYNIPVE